MYIHHMARMVRKQVYLSPEQNERLRRIAARQRRTEADVLREALDAQLEEHPPSKARVDRDALWSIVGVGTSKKGDLSQQTDAFLYGSKRR